MFFFTLKAEFLSEISSREVNIHINSLIIALCRCCLDPSQLINVDMLRNRISVFSYFANDCKALNAIKVLIEQQKNESESMWAYNFVLKYREFLTK